MRRSTSRVERRKPVHRWIATRRVGRLGAVGGVATCRDRPLRGQHGAVRACESRRAPRSRPTSPDMKVGEQAHVRVARPAGVGHPPHARSRCSRCPAQGMHDGELADPHSKRNPTSSSRRCRTTRNEYRSIKPDVPGRGRYLHAPRLLAGRQVHAGTAGPACRPTGRAVFSVPLPRLDVRPRRARVQEQAGAGQPARAAVPCSCRATITG